MEVAQVIWTIAGSDSSAGAGIQADIKTAQDIGIHCCSIITAITAQNTSKIIDILPINSRTFQKQIDVLEHEFRPQAIKTGMIATVEQALIIKKFLSKNPDIFYICDPVTMSSSGNKLCKKDTEEAIEKLLFPRANLLTPNYIEAQKISKCTSINVNILGKHILKAHSCQGVLIKGGHIPSETCVDTYMDETETFSLISPKNKNKTNVHGTGCALSTAIIAKYVQNKNIKDSIIQAKQYITNQIDQAKIQIKDINILKHNYNMATDINTLPKIKHLNIKINRYDRFQILEPKIGLYPIIDSYKWLSILANNNIKIVQLRIKNSSKETIEEEVQKSIQYANKYNIKLFINDYWELAIKYKAYGVHLGQTDIPMANLSTISKNKLALGVSTRSFYDLSVALSIQPSYIAVGPIYKTNSKRNLNKSTQGIEKVYEWKKLIKNIPLIAIGGINAENMDKLYSAGANGVAVIEYIQESTDVNENINKARIIYQKYT
jgi:hydroxymethylpyrimidine kinase/phosphomethylpyrimidine kinase/thiamine-phosphate diphosphorylase